MPSEAFRSKVDTWLVVVLGVAAILVSATVWSATRVGEMSLLAAAAVVALAVALPAWMFATTRYELSGVSAC